MMNKLFLILICIISQFAFSQNDKSSPINEYERIYVEAGFVQPIGKLSNKFELSPSFGFWFRNKMDREDYIDFGFNFFIPKNPIEPNFKYRDSVVQYKSSHFAINIGTRFAKVIPLSQRTTNFNLEWNSGIGLALNFYNAPKELEFDDGEHTKEVLTTFYLSQGIKVNYKNVGLQCHYQWSPYNLFNDQVEKDFGSQSLMFGIVYRQ
ncbi:hypothetical protein [Flavobacterium sp. JAS]|uniref:hypothetical protein n=1 Tax=Flavobacterium sp. JAS TaxID=2897329 RepID=UPI001E39A271|nr:hypothetical protein [Flavobacterium sp. JAS]MCD0468254.1 hypothetical protein [Flavobacterium sp. JAS]